MQLAAASQAAMVMVAMSVVTAVEMRATTVASWEVVQLGATTVASWEVVQLGEEGERDGVTTKAESMMELAEGTTTVGRGRRAAATVVA